MHYVLDEYLDLSHQDASGKIRLLGACLAVDNVL